MRQKKPIEIFPVNMQHFYESHPDLERPPAQAETAVPPEPTEKTIPPPPASPVTTPRQAASSTKQMLPKKPTKKQKSPTQPPKPSSAPTHNQPTQTSAFKKLIVFPRVIAERLRALAMALGEDESTVIRLGVTELFERKVVSGLVIPRRIEH